MKTVLFFLFSFLLSPGMHSQEQDKKKAQVVYTCVMHPEIQRTKPGNCPKCGMKLVVQKVATTTPTVKKPAAKPVTKIPDPPGTIYTCVMHPEIQKTKPGNCPKCGMKLVVQKTSSDHPPITQPAASGQIRTDSSLENKKTKDEAIPKAGHPVENPESTFNPKAVRYDLYVRDTIVDYAGKKKHAIAINGSIPGPTLTFMEGDTAEVYVHNMLKKETSIHWHGVFLPNQFDGVPYLTQMPIKPGQTHVYKFPILQNGTYWYHSHSKLQEQIGMYGALVFLKRKEPEIPTIPIVLSEWTNMKPYEVQRSLHNATDWFSIQKGSTQDYLDAIRHQQFRTKITNEWKRMLSMDVSDVYYKRFLLNGKKDFDTAAFKAGDKVKLRIVNAGAATYFWLTYAGGKITVVANDGNDVEPIEVDRLIISVAETYDVIVTIPDNKSYEFLATSEDRIGHASLWLGSGIKMPATPLPKLKYFQGMKMMNEMMKMNGNLDTLTMRMKMSNQMMDMNSVMYPEVTGEEMTRKEKRKNKTAEIKDTTVVMNDMDMTETPDIITLNYGMLRSPEKTTLPDGPVKELQFTLTGNMNRFVWSINNRTVSESDKILIHKGENIRIILYNNTMMRHPMHLHGHDFRVLNSEGEYSPLKNVLDIMPMETDTIEFAATESGDWFFHCHFLYHMMSGMGRVFSYENSPPNPELPNPEMAYRMLKKDDKMWHPMLHTSIESNGVTGEFMFPNRKNLLQVNWQLGLGYKDNRYWRVSGSYARYLDHKQFLSVYAGFDLTFDDNDGMLGETMPRKIMPMHPYVGVIGIRYVLPLLIIADLRVDNFGRPRFQLSRDDIPLTKRLRMSAMFNSDLEYMVGLRYIITKYFSISTRYDSDFSNNHWKKWGAGFTITY